MLALEDEINESNLFHIIPEIIIIIKIRYSICRVNILITKSIL